MSVLKFLFKDFTLDNSKQPGCFRTWEITMSNKSKVILIVFLGLLMALFVMLFMGLGDNPVVVPRAPL